jgi:hypothetical protein
MTGVCAKLTAGIEVERSLRIATAGGDRRYVSILVQF